MHIADCTSGAPTTQMEDVVALLHEAAKYTLSVSERLEHVTDRLLGAMPPVPTSAPKMAAVVECGGLLGALQQADRDLKANMALLESHVGRLAQAV